MKQMYAMYALEHFKWERQRDEILMDKREAGGEVNGWLVCKKAAADDIVNIFVG